MTLSPPPHPPTPPAAWPLSRIPSASAGIGVLLSGQQHQAGSEPEGRLCNHMTAGPGPSATKDAHIGSYFLGGCGGLIQIPNLGCHLQNRIIDSDEPLRDLRHLRWPKDEKKNLDFFISRLFQTVKNEASALRCFAARLDKFPHFTVSGHEQVRRHPSRGARREEKKKNSNQQKCREQSESRSVRTVAEQSSAIPGAQRHKTEVRPPAAQCGSGLNSNNGADGVFLSQRAL